MMRFTHPGRSFFAIALVLSTLLFLSSCAKKVAFQGSVYVPEAEGRVKIKKDKNNNYNINVYIRKLTDSRKLLPPRDNYVVWSATESNGVKNIGQITSSKPLFSKRLKAKLDAVSPFKPTRIFITAEDNGNVPYPGVQEVISTRDF